MPTNRTRRDKVNRLVVVFGDARLGSAKLSVDFKSTWFT